MDTYLKQMRNTFAPFGTITGTNCHSLKFETEGPWQTVALPDGVDEKDRDFTWTVVGIETLRVTVDLAALDEDKVIAQPMYALDDIKKHREQGTPYQATVAAVMFSVQKGSPLLNVYKVDIEKAAQHFLQTDVPESALGVTVQKSGGAIFEFTTTGQAAMFKTAMSKAIVLCKAQEEAPPQPIAAKQPNPISVFVYANCPGTLGNAVATSLRTSIRASSGFRLANSMADDGGKAVVLTVYLNCSEGQGRGSSDAAVSVASIIGPATCSLGGCHISEDSSALKANLCRADSAAGCGHDIYGKMKAYMDGPAGEQFEVLSRERTGSSQ